MVLRILIGVLLIIHGVIHWLLAMTPNPEAPEPAVATFFSQWSRPWLRELLSGGAIQAVAVTLAVIAGLGFVAAGMAVLDLVLPHAWWRLLAIGASVVSLILCLVFWKSWLIAGPVVAVGIIVVVGLLNWPVEATLGY